MTKMQIVAKAVFFALGIQIASEILSLMPLYVSVLPYPDFRIHGAVALTGLTIALVLIGWWLIIRGETVACRLINDSERPQNAQRQWLIISLHLVCFLSGLLLITQTGDLFAKVIVMPFEMRGFFNRVVWGENWSELFEFSINQTPNLFVNVLEAFAGIYLIVGAPHFIRWQVRRTEGFVTFSSQGARHE